MDEGVHHVASDATQATRVGDEDRRVADVDRRKEAQELASFYVGTDEPSGQGAQTGAALDGSEGALQVVGDEPDIEPELAESFFRPSDHRRQTPQLGEVFRRFSATQKPRRHDEPLLRTTDPALHPGGGSPSAHAEGEIELPTDQIESAIRKRGLDDESRSVAEQSEDLREENSTAESGWR